MGVINFSEANCRNCYKCIRHCPVKAIQMVNKQAQIIEDLCIGCGNCFKVCPQNAKNVVSFVDQIKEWLKNETVVLSLAPSFPSAFDLEDPNCLLTALRTLGFEKIEETAIGAEIVSEYYAKDYQSTKKHVITTSCPTVNLLIEKYYPQAVPYLSEVLTPMLTHAKILHHKYPETKIVFVGPCISKKLEAEECPEDIDAVMSFDELREWLAAEKIEIKKLQPGKFDSTASDVARYYPLTGGVVKSSFSKNKAKRHIVKIDGLDNCRDFLDHIEDLKDGYWIEMNACVESCINGPGNVESPMIKYEKKERVRQYIQNNPRENIEIKKYNLDYSRKFSAKPIDYVRVVPEEDIQSIMHKMGKFKHEDELNCGSCGYDTCREKAIAVYNGMAEVDMCLPYMRNLNETMSNLIIGSTPNAIVVCDNEMRIIEFNYAAEKIFKVSHQAVQGQIFQEVLDYHPFSKMAGSNTYSGRGYYPKGQIHFIEVLAYVPEHQMYIGIFVDISDKIRKEEAYKKMQIESFEMAQKVVDKQMRVAHQIAELLGETTAETRVSMTKIKNLIQPEEIE